MGLRIDENLSNRVRVINCNTEYSTEMVTAVLGCPLHTGYPIFVAVDSHDFGVVVGYDQRNNDLLTVRTPSGNRQYDHRAGVFIGNDMVTYALPVSFDDKDTMAELDRVVAALSSLSELGSVFYSPMWEILSWSHLSVVVPVHMLTGSFNKAFSQWLRWNNLQLVDERLTPTDPTIGPVYNYAKISRKAEDEADIHIFQNSNSLVTFKSDQRTCARNVEVDFYNINDWNHCPFNCLGHGVSMLMAHGFTPYHISKATAAEQMPRLLEALECPLPKSSGSKRRNVIVNLRNSN